MCKDKNKKEDIIKELSTRTGFSSNLSKRIINDLVEILVQELKTGHLNLKNLGSFKIIQKKERMGRNPKTKKEYLISSRKSISFTTSKNIVDYLNKSFWTN